MRLLSLGRLALAIPAIAALIGCASTVTPTTTPTRTPSPTLHLTQTPTIVLATPTAEDGSKGEAYIRVICPNGGEEWVEGNTYDILWESSGIGKVAIQTAIGGKDKGHITFGVDATLGRFSWTIPKGFVSGFGISRSDSAKVRIYDTENPFNYDGNDEDFSIIAGSGLPSPAAKQGVSESVSKMIGYLSANYDSDVRLIREATNVAPNAYWLYTDNYLASLALREAKADIAGSITEGMAGWEFEPLRCPSLPCLSIEFRLGAIADYRDVRVRPALEWIQALRYCTVDRGMRFFGSTRLWAQPHGHRR